MEWKKNSEELIKEGYRQIVKREYSMPDGSTHDFEIIIAKQTAVIIGITTKNNIVLAEQYRPGPEKTLRELPGGAVDPGETIATAAAREFLEETGYTGDFAYIGSHYEGAYSTCVRNVFVAKNCHKIADPKSDDTEFIEPLEMSLPEFRQHLRSGELTDVSAGYMALDYLKLL